MTAPASEVGGVYSPSGCCRNADNSSYFLRRAAFFARVGPLFAAFFGLLARFAGEFFTVFLAGLLTGLWAGLLAPLPADFLAASTVFSTAFLAAFLALRGTAAAFFAAS